MPPALEFGASLLMFGLYFLASLGLVIASVAGLRYLARRNDTQKP